MINGAKYDVCGPVVLKDLKQINTQTELHLHIRCYGCNRCYLHKADVAG